MAYADVKKLLKDESGTTLIEFTAAAFTFFIVLFGIVEFSHVYYRWNAATKAVQIGARLAAVSSPVSSDLAIWNGLLLPAQCYVDSAGAASAAIPGAFIKTTDPACVFKRECVSSASSGSAGTCTNGGIYNALAMQTIVFGRGKSACAAATTPRNLGMCNIFIGLNATQVVVNYNFTGLGYAGRPGGPVPTVTVGLRNVPYNVILLGAFLSTDTITMPSFATTVTGEDLNALWSS